MSNDELTDLAGESAGDEMFADLGHFETGAIPVDAVVKRGKAIRNRRRVVGGGVLAAAAALTIAVPVALAGGSPKVYAASGGGTRVTVNPTTVSGGKGHFSGTVDGKKWSVDYNNKDCIGLSTPCGSDGPFPWDLYTLAQSTDWGQTPDEYVLFLRAGVDRAEVTLQDGEHLSLAAVPVVNGPVVVFDLPFGLGVGKIEVFDVHGNELAYTLPFTVKGFPSVSGRWYQPGETPASTTGSVELAKEQVQGAESTYTAYIGPAGPCIVWAVGGHPNANCHSGSSVLKGSMEFPEPVQGEAQAGLVDPKIDHLQADLSDGTKSTIVPKKLGDYRFYAFITPDGKKLAGITAFDAQNRPLPTPPMK